MRRSGPGCCGSSSTKHATAAARRAAARRSRCASPRAPGRGDAAPSPETALLACERREELLSAVNRLVEKDRLAITCRYLLDLSEDETADALGWRRGTVKSRLSRALGRLRVELGGEDG